MIECYFMCQSDNGSITESHALRRWSQKYIRSLEGIKDPRAPLRLQTLFTAAGLVEVENRMVPLPLCAWANSMFLFCSLGPSLRIAFLSAVPWRGGMTLIRSFSRSQRTPDW